MCAPLLQGFVYKMEVFRPEEKAWLGLAEVSGHLSNVLYCHQPHTQTSVLHTPNNVSLYTSSLSLLPSSFLLTSFDPSLNVHVHCTCHSLSDGILHLAIGKNLTSPVLHSCCFAVFMFAMPSPHSGQTVLLPAGQGGRHHHCHQH